MDKMGNVDVAFVKIGIWVPGSHHYYFPHTHDSLDQIKAKKRTHDNAHESILAIESQPTKKAKQTLITQTGIKGRSPLLQLLSIRFPKSLPLDSMHHLFLNFGPDCSNLLIEENLTQEQILEINEILSKTSFPSWIEKEIRSLSDMGSWKAEQWKNFLLYLALPLIRKRASSHTYSFWCELTTVMLKLVSLEVSVDHIPFLEEQIFSLIQKYEIKYKIKQR